MTFNRLTRLSRSRLGSNDAGSDAGVNTSLSAGIDAGIAAYPIHIRHYMALYDPIWGYILLYNALFICHGDSYVF